MDTFERDIERSHSKNNGDSSLKGNWSVLFVDEQGRVLRVNFIKVIVSLFFVLAILSVLFISCAISFYFLRQNNTKPLKMRLEKLTNENNLIKKENEKAKAKLALLNQLYSKDSPDFSGTSGLSKEKELSGTGEKSFSDMAIKKEAIKKENDFQNKKYVDIKDLKISKGSDFTKIEFNIVKTASSEENVSGYIFVILWSDTMDEKDWMVSPYSVVLDKKPADPAKGQFFSISRFKPVEIKFLGRIDLDKYTNAKILVYSEKKELIFEKVFPSSQG
ncbi:MAG: hypothetical protein CSB21_03715 [Deltaproteobacteria bacterium]|nr:MAG: hypothetical protein CSB21_03715 [Deltaproteobacteria bacterium]